MTNLMQMAPTSSTEFHLTEDQLDDQLMGDLAAAPAEHLATCALCTQRVAEAGAPLASFGAVSLAWAERVSATSEMPVVATPSTVWERRLGWSMALASCAVVMAITGANHGFAGFNAQAASPAMSQSVASAPSSERVSSDNQMLKTIDFELADSSESSATLGLVSAGSATRSRAAGPALRD